MTTHLDADTIMVLVRELNAYEGALLVVTHDRFFMRAVVEGEDPIDEDEGERGGGDHGGDWNDERKGPVWLLEKGRMRILAGGVAEWEKRALRKSRRGEPK